MSRHLVWLRADLRSVDNTALAEASRDPSVQVAALYCVTPGQWAAHDKAGCQVDFELRTLAVLQKTLLALDIPLLILNSTDFSTLPEDLLALCRDQRIDAVYWNRQYEWNELRRDEAVSTLLDGAGISTYAFDDQCLVTPGDVRTGDGRFYTVFTPFKKNWLHTLHRHPVDVFPAPTRRLARWTDPSSIPKAVPGFTSHVDEGTARRLWPAGENAALARLTDFVDGGLRRYRDLRDLPSRDDGTSHLSPYLAIGAISPRQCWQSAINDLQAFGPSEHIDQWVSELGWRDFYKHLMIGFPRVCKHQPFRTDTRALIWRNDPDGFVRWCEGRTGFPIVDAAMRQLLETGWMHNRLRMVVSMFLVKDLFIDWRLGERHFMLHLIDGDLSANNGGWQWSASTGNDAAPYFRIFNPVLQSRRFDPEGDFIRRFVPELSGIDAKRIHEPHAGQRLLGTAYPEPMLNHAAACAYTIEQFKGLKTMPIGRAEGY